MTGVKDSPAEVVRQTLIRNFSPALAFPTALIWDAQGLPLEQADAEWKKIVQTVRQSSAVSDIYDGRYFLSPWPRQDWYAAFVELKADNYAKAEAQLAPLRQDINKNYTPPEGHPWYITGGPALFLDLNLASTEALRKAELTALPIAAIILLIVFRSAVAALLPIITAGCGVVCTLGLLSLLAPYWPITFFVPNLVTMIGLGVGIDYCLIYLARYRMERSFHLTPLEALVITRRTAGPTVMASAVLVMSGFLALLIIPLTFFHSIAIGGILVVGTVGLATVTLLPALIFLLGPHLEWGRVHLGEGKMAQRVKYLYQRWSRLLVVHPVTFFVLGIALLLFFAWPVLRLQVASIQVKTLPAHAEARKGYESMERMLGPGWLMPLVVLVKHAPGESMLPETMERERELVQQLSTLPNTEKVVSLSEAVADPTLRRARMSMLTGNADSPDPSALDQTLILLVSKTDPQSNAARSWIRDIETILKWQEAQHPSGPKYLLGGVAATTAATDEVIFAALPKVVGFTLITTFVLLTYFMKSFFVPLKAIGLNVLCVLAAYGFQVMWFQDGVGQKMGHFFHVEGINTIVQIICFCTLFGLSMDYEVFILCAVKECWNSQGKIRLSIQEGLQRTAGIITSAAMIMVCVFLCFAFGSVVETQQLGLGLSFAVLLDATIIRLVLVPCALILLGSWAWWWPFSRSNKARKKAERHRAAGI